MKRIITLMLALGLVFGAVANSSAAEIKAKGSFTMEYGWMDNLNFEKGSSTGGDGRSEDDFIAQQRFRTQIDIVASENLSGVVFFEIDNAWGRNVAGDSKTKGGQLGADGINVETKRAFIDWTVPNTDLAFRMGIQGLALPAPVAGSSILDDDVAAILATYKFNDMLTLNAFWARPYDSRQGERYADVNFHEDEIDLFGLIAGIELDGMTITPWAMYGAVGAGAEAVGGLQSLFAANAPSGVISGNATNNWGPATHTALPAFIYNSYNGTENIDNHRAWWLGLGYELNMFDPIVFSFEAVYGKVDGGDLNYRLTGVNGTDPANAFANGTVFRSDDDILDREGWALAAKLSYKMDMLTPGIIGWYATGEDDDITNGSERLPVISGAFSPTTFGFDGYAGGNVTPTGDLLGTSYDGKWGLGLVLEDIKVIEDLTSQIRVVYVKGTNDHDVLDSLVKYTSTSKATFLSNNIGTFMTDKDQAWEVNFDHKYMIYENLAMIVELGYVNLDLNDSAWGLNQAGATKYDEDAWKANLIFQYTF
ncbi:outer membrane homotrimeric porin [Desulfovibrio psychrotolerans]|uniref:Outer membrane homotrimeric porin n=1 Tax=Desulfovibrio psychrotolerans TaxID=415242 RepID=A0A7J0BTH0_9BACT|nr:outer membrane homotrimeric porin [Desulfovibrio psychrotolerans]GFM37009.1 hypothetical protein DSM19430T_16930 [Desulfovibrio psychrotolerans]